MTLRNILLGSGAVLLGALLLVAYTRTPGADLGQSRLEQARSEVERANADELAAVIEGDAARAAAYFIDDAILLPPDGSVVRGRQAIEAYWAPVPGTRITGADTETVYFDVEGNRATLVGRYTLSIRSGDETTTYVGTFFMVWHRVDHGIWRIVADAWTSRETD